MDSIRPRGDCNINPIIDKHARSPGSGDLDYARNKGCQFACFEVAFTHLDELTSRSSGNVDRFELRFSAPRMGKREPLGDQVYHRTLRKSVSSGHVYDYPMQRICGHFRETGKSPRFRQRRSKLQALLQHREHNRFEEPRQPIRREAFRSGSIEKHCRPSRKSTAGGSAKCQPRDRSEYRR
jgi:hypothetical protein